MLTRVLLAMYKTMTHITLETYHHMANNYWSMSIFFAMYQQ